MVQIGKTSSIKGSNTHKLKTSFDYDPNSLNFKISSDYGPLWQLYMK